MIFPNELNLNMHYSTKLDLFATLLGPLPFGCRQYLIYPFCTLLGPCSFNMAIFDSLFFLVPYLDHTLRALAIYIYIYMFVCVCVFNDGHALCIMDSYD